MGNPITQLEQLVLNTKSKDFLREITRWCFFFAILGFIGIAFLIIAALLIGTLYSASLDVLAEQQGLPSLGFILISTYLVSAGLSFFPVLYLFKFSKKMRLALAAKSDELLADAFAMLKSHFKFMGVLTIIVISLYALLIIFYLVFGSLV
jgi:hypothetical protein|tara:strand:- start:5964 stop:6413 length:450 start_codon:yes stop_codon:yes gene_type:complete